MQTRHHPLSGTAPGTQRQITSFHYGPADGQRKVYIQASLHADELPGMLVAHHLRLRFAALEQAQRLRAEIVVVPMANPIGLAQSVLRQSAGRFELASGENFNRYFLDRKGPALAEVVGERLEGRLGDDPQVNATRVRDALREAIATWPEDTELASQRKVLMGLACDAEVVLDLHCDGESLVHLYTGTPLWPQAEPLARLIGAQASLLALESGDQPFDEACSQTWWQLEERFRGRHPVPMGCLSVTVELRGLHQVTHAQAAQDAEAIVAFLVHRGLIDGTPVDLPPLLQEATPFAATDVLVTPVSGLVVYLRELGDTVRAGEVLIEVIDPLSGAVTPIASRTDGLLFAREHQRYTPAGRSLAKVRGTVPLRTGKLSAD